MSSKVNLEWSWLVLIERQTRHGDAWNGWYFIYSLSLLAMLTQNDTDICTFPSLSFIIYKHEI